MNLQGRNLAIEKTGDDAKLLLMTLRQLVRAVPEDEAGCARFEQGTLEMAIASQRHRNIEATGIVDAATTEVIADAVEAVDTMRPAGFVVQSRHAGLFTQPVERNSDPPSTFHS